MEFRRFRQQLAWVSAVTSLALPAFADADGGCPVVNLMPAFWAAFDAQSAPPVQALAALVGAHRDLYNPNLVNLPAGADWQKTVAQEQAYVTPHRKEVEDATAYLADDVPRLMRRFQDTFPEFRCDFPFYVAPSFGRMDGAAALTAGQHRIIFAPDVVARYHALSELRVLIDHETFHIYHHQATGDLGAFDVPVPTVLQSLWSEGLATFVSWRMNPELGLDVAMLQPGIPEGARPRLAQIARDLLQHLDEHDEVTFNHYFVGGRQPAGYPPRAGYYVGVLLAQDLAGSYALPQLARLDGAPLHEAVTRRLQAMAAIPAP